MPVCEQVCEAGERGGGEGKGGEGKGRKDEKGVGGIRRRKLREI